MALRVNDSILAADTMAIAGLLPPPPSLPPLQVTSSWVRTSGTVQPTVIQTVLATHDSALVIAQFNFGSYNWFPITTWVTFTDSLLTLTFDPGGGPFASVSNGHLVTVIRGLPPGPHRLRLLPTATTGTLDTSLVTP
jgi:hypothetical protein